ncbi:MAG: TlyA family RNA methyltransferase [Bacilli bacterium]|nr:TlyA family RNA methyltransferase [Bacilli bacterium]
MDRLDSLLVKKGLVVSRTRGEYEIKNGNVLVDGKVVTKPSTKFNEDVKIEINNKLDYVSKGALKLLKAIDTFNIDLSNKVMLDIGSSTGGFSDVALRNNIKKVIAVDVGTNQFDKELQKDSRIELHENTDIRSLIIKDEIDTATIDISFISVTKIIDKLKDINPKEIVLLIKPQFECGKEISDKYKGIPLNKEVHKKVIENIINSFESIGYYILGLTYSPIKGGSGNIEYLGYFTKTDKNNIDIEKNVNIAFDNLLQK